MLRSSAYRRLLLPGLLLFAGSGTQVQAQLSIPTPSVSVDAFRRVALTGKYYSEGAGVGDFNHDGKVDVVSGPFWYEGPAFTQRHTIYTPVKYMIGSYANQFHVFGLDLNGDTCDDILTIGFPGTRANWYENPKRAATSWTRHLVGNKVGTTILLQR